MFFWETNDFIALLTMSRFNLQKQWYNFSYGSGGAEVTLDDLISFVLGKIHDKKTLFIREEGFQKEHVTD